MKGWVGLVGWPVADGLLTLVVIHQLQVERRTGKVRRPETDVLPLCYATNLVAVVALANWCTCTKFSSDRKHDGHKQAIFSYYDSLFLPLVCYEYIYCVWCTSSDFLHFLWSNNCARQMPLHYMGSGEIHFSQCCVITTKAGCEWVNVFPATRGIVDKAPMNDLLLFVYVQPTAHNEIISHMAKLTDTIAVPMARASILWLIGEYSDRVPKIAPDVLRKMAKNFVNEVRLVIQFAFDHLH